MNPSSAVEPELISSEEKSAETSFQVSLPPRISNLFYPSALIFSGAGRFTESIPQIRDITGTGDLKPRITGKEKDESRLSVRLIMIRPAASAVLRYSFLRKKRFRIRIAKRYGIYINSKRKRVYHAEFHSGQSRALRKGILLF